MEKTVPNAGKILKMIEKKDVEGLVKVLIQVSRPDYTRLHGGKMAESITEELAKIGKPAVSYLILTLSCKESKTREHAAKALEKIGEPAVEPLIRALKNRNRYIREYAAEILGKIKDRRAVEPLLRTLKDKEESVREKAVWALGEIGDEKAVNPLLQSLKEQPALSTMIIEALGKIGNAKAVEPLIEALDDEYPPIRKCAAWALGKIRDGRAVEPLFRVIREGKNYLKYPASFGEEFVMKEPVLREQVETVLTAAEALYTMGKLTLDPLIKTLGEEDPSTRNTAEWTLQQVREKIREKQ
ncbi:MAG: HEAT repeat domain-containing protein [Candidatus Jordarchaeaceae archaeon]